MDSPILKHFIRKVELPQVEQVSLAQVEHMVKRYQRPVKGAGPVSLAARFIKTNEVSK